MIKYSLNPRSREVYLARLVAELRTISGVDYERFGCLLMDRVSPVPLQHRGINLDGAPVGHTLDSASSDGKYVAEYSSEATYFATSGKKIRKDVRHALTLHPQVKNLWLSNNTEAGEKRSTQLRNTINRVKRRCGINIEIYDSRRTAEFIVDNLLLNKSTAVELGVYLPSLTTFAAEMAATYQVPDPSPNFLERGDEMNRMLCLLETERVVALSGVSGSGKSDLAAAIVAKVRSGFQVAAWVDAKEIANVNQLGKFDITGSGATVNILGALSERSAIVVLDDAHASLNLDVLRSKCAESSRVIITTQIAFPKSLEIGPLGMEESRSVLSSGIEGPSPEDTTLENIRANVGSNALALSLLNAHKRETGCSWEDLIEVSAFADALLDDRQVKLATRLLGRAEQSIGSELEFLRWCGTQAVDRGLAQFVISPVGISNLERFKLLSLSRPRSLRLHELVFKAIDANVKVGDDARTHFDSRFAEYIGLHAPSKDIEFYTVIHHHRNRIEAELKKGNAQPALQYAYFLSTQAREIIPALIPAPDSVVDRFCSAPSELSSELAVMACIEALEKQFLRIRQATGIEAGVQYVKSLLGTYKVFTELPHGSDRVKSITKHHYAKALRRTGDIDSARTMFEDILAGPWPLESSRLQLARIYTELSRKSDALSLVKLVLDSAIENPNGIAATVLLESVRLLLNPALKPESQQVFHHYRRRIADRIVLLASIGFGQAFETFSVVASSWAYSDPVLFEELFQSLPPITSEEQMSNEERGAWGEVFLAASSNTKDVALKEGFGRKACSLLIVFKDSADEFKRQRFAKAQLQLEDYSGAVETLEKTALPARKEWWHYWRGKAHAGLKQYSDAVNEFDAAIAASKAPRSAFFASRAEALAAMSDPKCIEDFETAIRVGADNPEYESFLREQLRISKINFEAV